MGQYRQRTRRPSRFSARAERLAARAGLLVVALEPDFAVQVGVVDALGDDAEDRAGPCEDDVLRRGAAAIGEAVDDDEVAGSASVPCFRPRFRSA
jgi:hypothetical protein